MSDFGFKVKFYARKSFLHVFGPATLDEQTDPHAKMERSWLAHFGKVRKPVKPTENMPNPSQKL